MLPARLALDILQHPFELRVQKDRRMVRLIAVQIVSGRSADVKMTNTTSRRTIAINLSVARLVFATLVNRLNLQAIGGIGGSPGLASLV